MYPLWWLIKVGLLQIEQYLWADSTSSDNIGICDSEEVFISIHYTIVLHSYPLVTAHTIWYGMWRGLLVGTSKHIWFQPLRGWSHRRVLTPSVEISGCNSVKSGGPTSISKHNPQQFHSWNRTESLVWLGHESDRELSHLVSNCKSQNLSYVQISELELW